MKTLRQLYDEHQGKVSDKWSLYLAEYDRVLAPYRSCPINLLEIGVQNGGSLEIWAKYFGAAQHLIGCDVNSACAILKYADSRIAIVVGDANLSGTERVIAALAERFDIVIDDGSHKSGDIVNSFVRYFPRLKEGGVFIAEDLHCSYWEEFDGGLYHPYSSVSFFKQLADVVNQEHWGVNKRHSELLQRFAAEYGSEFSDEFLRTIHSVTFVNSLCIVHKAAPQANGLGRRFIAGEEALVSNEMVSLRGQDGAASVPTQAENRWTALAGSPAELWLPTIELSARRDRELDTLRMTSINQAQRITEMNDKLTRTGNMVKKLQDDAMQSEGRFAELRLMSDRQESRILALRAKVSGLRAEITTLEASNVTTEGHLSHLRGEVVARDQEILRHQNDIRSMLCSTSWRLTAPIRWPKVKYLQMRSLMTRVAGAGGMAVVLRKAYGVYRRDGLVGVKDRIKWFRAGAPGSIARHDYSEWIRKYDQVDDTTRDRIRKRIAEMKNPPTISVVMPVYNPKPEWLGEAIDSVRNQLYPHWELCIADDVSPNPEVRKLLQRYATADKRIKVVFREKNGHISAASNSALEVATGSWVALLDHDDLLPEHALFSVADTILQNPNVSLIYSDEDKINEAGERCDPYFKSSWNLDLFYSHNMFSHLGVYRKSLLDEIGGFRLGYEGSQDYDLVLRCLERVDQKDIYHIPRVLYHWRVHAESTASGAEAKPYAAIAGEKAINEHFARRGVQCNVEYIGYGYRAHYALPVEQPLVSLIVPTRNAVELMRQCLDSLFEKTLYQNYEVIIVDNGSDDPEAVEYFRSMATHPRVRVLRDDRPFNYSALNNAAVKHAKGDLIGLLNNDIEVITPEWLSEMVSLAIQPDIGAVGARLLYPDETIQHAGLILGILGVAGNAHKHAPRSTNGYFGRASLINGFSAVTAACMLMRKSVYEEVGGLNEVDLTVAYNDVDLCLRISEAGYRNVWTPYAELYHHESATRGEEDDPVKQARFMGEYNYMRRRWEAVLADDAYYSPNLTLDHDDFSLAWPPRVKSLA